MQIIAASALLALLAQPAIGQGVLTLEEAQALADRTSPTAGIARARLEKAEAARSGAWAALFPALTAAATYTHRGTEISRLVEGVRITQPQDIVRADVGIDLTVFDARALAVLSASGSGLDAQALESEEARRGLSFSVSAAYYGVLSAESLIAAAIKRREAAEATVAEARARFDAGLAARNDLTRTELELAVARQEETAAVAARARARLSLGTWVGMDVVGERPLAEPPPLTIPVPNAASMEALALAERGDVRALLARVDQLDTLADEPLYRIIPTLGVRGALELSNESTFGGPPVDGSFSATLTWRIFDGGARYADRDSRLADLREGELRVEEARIRVQREVREAIVLLEEARSTQTLIDERARIAAQNALEVRTLFSSGLAGALEQVDAAVAEFEANASASRQKVSVRVAELSLLAAMGSWPGQRKVDSEP